jgi:hypothetical protein
MWSYLWSLRNLRVVMDIGSCPKLSHPGYKLCITSFINYVEMQKKFKKSKIISSFSLSRHKVLSNCVNYYLKGYHILNIIGCWHGWVRGTLVCNNFFLPKHRIIDFKILHIWKATHWEEWIQGPFTHNYSKGLWLYYIQPQLQFQLFFCIYISFSCVLEGGFYLHHFLSFCLARSMEWI